MTKPIKIILWTWLSIVLICMGARAQTNPYVQVYWNFTNMVGPAAATVSRAKLEPLPPFPIINGQYVFPVTNTFQPSLCPSMTNGSITTNLIPGIQYRFSVSGPFGSLCVTDAPPIQLLISNTPPYNMSAYDINLFTNGTTNIPFTGISYLYAGNNITIQLTNGGIGAIINSIGGGGGGVVYAGTNIVLTITNVGTNTYQVINVSSNVVTNVFFGSVNLPFAGSNSFFINPSIAWTPSAAVATVFRPTNGALNICATITNISATNVSGTLNGITESSNYIIELSIK